MTRDPLRRAYEHNPGVLAHAARLLRVLAESTEGNGPDTREHELHMQAVEVGRAVRALDRVARRRRPLRPLVSVLSPTTRALLARLTTEGRICRPTKRS